MDNAERRVMTNAERRAEIERCFECAENCADRGEAETMESYFFRLRCLSTKAGSSDGDAERDAEERIASIGIKGYKNALARVFKECESELDGGKEGSARKALESAQAYITRYAEHHNTLRQADTLRHVEEAAG